MYTSSPCTYIIFNKVFKSVKLCMLFSLLEFLPRICFEELLVLVHSYTVIVWRGYQMVMVAYFCNRKSTVPGWPNLRRHIECLIQKKWETIIYKIPIKNYILYEQKVVPSTFLVLQLFTSRGPHDSTCKDKSVPGRTTIEILGSRLIRVSLVWSFHVLIGASRCWHKSSIYD